MYSQVNLEYACVPSASTDSHKTSDHFVREMRDCMYVQRVRDVFFLGPQDVLDDGRQLNVTRVIPNAFILGAAKAGTTFLYDCIADSKCFDVNAIC
eukprot:5641289-Ditylum_brightwellii.AAC.1